MKSRIGKVVAIVSVLVASVVASADFNQGRGQGGPDRGNQGADRGPNRGPDRGNQGPDRGGQDRNGPDRGFPDRGNQGPDRGFPGRDRGRQDWDIAGRLCTGTFNGVYLGANQQFSLAFTYQSGGIASVIQQTANVGYQGTASCRPVGPDSVSVQITFNGTAALNGTITQQQGSTVFTGMSANNFQFTMTGYGQGGGAPPGFGDLPQQLCNGYFNGTYLGANQAFQLAFIYDGNGRARVTQTTANVAYYGNASCRQVSANEVEVIIDFPLTAKLSGRMSMQGNQVVYNGISSNNFQFSMLR